MSGSMFSLLTNDDNSQCNRSYKDFKNMSNFERQNLDQCLKKPMYDALESFSRDLRNYVPQCGEHKMSTEQSSSVSLKRLNQPPAQSPRSVSRNSCTTPKIVGAEVKKNIKYQPAYMQRHSASFGEGFVYPTEVNQHQSYSIQQYNKRSSVAFGEGYANLVDAQNQARSSRLSASHTLPTPMEGVQSGGVTQSGNCVRDRVSFFNKLASSSDSPSSRPTPTQQRETFLSLLRRNESKDSKTTVIRLSQLMATLSAKRASSKDSIQGMNSPDPGTGKCCVHVYKSGANSLPLPLRRKLSFEKTKLATSSIAKNMNAIGTNLKRHSLMEDLSLVVPVKLRIAEFEKRILESK